VSDREPKGKPVSVRDAAWFLVIGSQAGLILAAPVLACLAAGYLLDRRLGTLPWITLSLTLVGTVVGPVLVYRWVTAAVRGYLDRKQ